MSQTINAAQIILDQLGGRNKLRIAIGAKDFFSDNDGRSLVFKIGVGAQKGIRHIEVSHNSMDTYDVTFSKITRKKDKTLNIMIPELATVSQHQGVYADNLKAIIEEATGFYLSPFG